MTGIWRNLEGQVNHLLDVFPVVMLLGARQAGKTTLSRMVHPDWRYFDLENAADHDLVTRDYDFFFREHPRRVIIDEAQEDPRLFRQLRGVVDAARGETGPVPADRVQLARPAPGGRATPWPGASPSWRWARSRSTRPPACRCRPSTGCSSGS